MASSVAELLERINGLEMERVAALGRWHVTDREVIALNAALRDAMIVAARDPERIKEIAALQTTGELAMSLNSDATAPTRRTERDSLDALDVCNAIGQWANAAGVTTGAGSGAIVAAKSDLLGRLIYGGEAGPSQSRCPVHHGVWSGCHTGWPGEADSDPDPGLQAMWDAGCRCATHLGSNCTTGWNPDRNCCAP